MEKQSYFQVIKVKLKRNTAISSDETLAILGFVYLIGLLVSIIYPLAYYRFKLFKLAFTFNDHMRPGILK